MNWYKKSNLVKRIVIKSQYQPDLPFKPSLPQPVDFANMSLKEILDELDGENANEVFPILDKYNFEYSIVEFQTGKKLVLVGIKDEDPEYVSELGDSLWFSEIRQWLWDVDDDDLRIFSGKENFWDEIGDGTFVYHATDEKYVQSIMKKGLLTMDKTRGMTNRSTGPAVFTSFSHESIDAYGGVVIKIDLGAMKRDGYMPETSSEEPLQAAELREALAYKLGIQDFNARDGVDSDGLSEDTVIIYGNIPPKYLSVMK